MFVFCQLIQNYWLAANVENSPVSRILRFIVCTLVSRMLANALLLRSFSTVALGCGASRFTISTLLTSLCRAPMSFYESTPVGRMPSPVLHDLNVIDVEVAFRMAVALSSAINTYTNFDALAFFT